MHIGKGWGGGGYQAKGWGGGGVNIRLPYKNREINTLRSIGTIDLETLILPNDKYNHSVDNIEDLGIGTHLIYAGGWSINKVGTVKIDEFTNDDILSEKIIIDNDSINNSSELIDKMFRRLFDNEYDVNNYTLYAHNLGRFDAIFLIKELALLNYIIKPLWKDNAILKIVIEDAPQKSNKEITILDSINILPSSL